MINNNRKFGIEIELISQLHRPMLAEIINRAGVPCRAEAYNHNTRNHWKLVTDASLGNGGAELVSPILKGQDGLNQLKKVLDAINENGEVTVNRSTGLHVHHDARDLNGTQMENIVLNYSKFSSNINGVLPRSRRNSQWARIQTSVARSSENAHTVADACPRYSAVNLSSFSRHGTVEFRQHSGSTEYEKIASWIEFTQALVETSNERATDGSWSGMFEFLNAGTAVNTTQEFLNQFQQARHKKEFSPAEGTKGRTVIDLMSEGMTNESVLVTINRLFDTNSTSTSVRYWRGRYNFNRRLNALRERAEIVVTESIRIDPATRTYFDGRREAFTA